MAWTAFLGAVPVVCTSLEWREESTGILYLSKSQTATIEKVAICKFQEITSNRILHGRADVVVMPFILSHWVITANLKSPMASLLRGKLYENQVMG